jgi:DNA invertase Pin-like site-specific DNA recombinase
MRAAAYLRVSTKAQDHATQRSALLRAAAARRDSIVTWYAEKRGGQKLARPQLDQLREDARRGLVRRLYVYRIDRLTRSGIRDTFDLLEELRAAGVELVTVADGFDVNGPAADVVLAVMAWAAKMERLATAERIADTIARFREEGRPWGRPPLVDAAGHKRIRKLRTEGRSVRAIAVALKLPRSVVGRALAPSRKPAPGSPSRKARRSTTHRGPSRQ